MVLEKFEIIYMSIKNIVVFTNTLEKGGAEIQAIELAKVLSEKYQVYIVVFYGKQINIELIKRLDGYNIKLAKFSGNKIKCIKELYLLLKNERIDCVYSFLMTTNFYNALICKLFKKIISIGGIRSSKYSGLKLLMQKILHNYFFDKTISNNNAAIVSLSEKGFKKDKFVLIHNAFPIPLKTVVRTNINDDQNIIVTVARFAKVKDYETSLLAIKLLYEKSPIKFQYYIVGYGELESEIVCIINDYMLNDVVKIFINPDNIPELLINSDIYLSTSLFEGTSNSILEAMYANIPIVATDVGDNSYMVTDDNGFLVKPKDATLISEKLLYLLLNSTIRKQMGNKSKERVVNNFGSEVFKRRNFLLLEELEDETR